MDPTLAYILIFIGACVIGVWACIDAMPAKKDR